MIVVAVPVMMASIWMAQGRDEARWMIVGTVGTLTRERLGITGRMGGGKGEMRTVRMVAQMVEMKGFKRGRRCWFCLMF